jgi:hypothetical protein
MRSHLFAALAVCCGLSFGLPQAYASQDCSTTNNIVTGNHRISAWKWNFSSGYFCRSYSGDCDYLRVDLDEPASAGSDGGVGKNVSSGKIVDTMAIGLGVDAAISYSVTGGGWWWAGPKTIISSSQYYSGLNGQYECYIIERASVNPSTVVSKLGLNYKGEATYDGSVYKHYTVLLTLGSDKINQIWSIRQNYRSSGWTSVGYIQQKWRALGIVPNWYNLGWKYNVEFSGAQKGYFQMDHFNLPWN